MWKLSLLLVCVNAALVILAEDKSSQDITPVKEPSTPQEGSDLEQTMDGLGWCKEDREAAGICITCAQLPGVLAVPPGECCTDENALVICKTCVEDPLSCLRHEIDIVQGNGDENQARQMLDKRYGMLFLGQRPSYADVYPDAEKRFGTLNLGSLTKRSDSVLETGDLMDKRWGSLGLSKRFGTLNLGNRFAKRYGMLGLGSPYLGYLSRGYGNMEKRFGTLNMGGGRYRFGKRYGTLNMDKKWGTLNMANKRDLLYGAELDKRFGTLSLGKRYGTLNIGTGYESPSLGKRYGTLNMGRSYGYFPYKRSEYVPYNGNIGIDMRKRYGRLFMGRLGGKRLGSANEIRISEIKK